MVKIMYTCKRCGTKFEGNFCTGCGVKYTLSRICGRCGEIVIGRYCGKCGAKYEEPSEISEETDSSVVTLPSEDKPLLRGSIGLKYGPSGGGYAVTGIGECADSDVAIPAVSAGKIISSVASSAFSSCMRLRSVALPDFATSVGANAFYNCTHLGSVIIPDSVTEIGACAFSYCSVLKTVFYAGGRAGWDRIKVGAGNEPLMRASIYLYSENEPSGVGNFWHYADGKVLVWNKEE